MNKTPQVRSSFDSLAGGVFGPHVEYQITNRINEIQRAQDLDLMRNGSAPTLRERVGQALISLGQVVGGIAL